MSDFKEIERKYFEKYKTTFNVGDILHVKDTKLVTELVRDKEVKIIDKHISFAENVVYGFIVDGIYGTLPERFLENYSQ